MTAFGTVSRALHRLLSRQTYHGTVAVDLGCGSGFIASGFDLSVMASPGAPGCRVLDSFHAIRAAEPILETRRFLYLYVLLASHPLGSPQDPSYERSLLSEEQKEAARRRQNDFCHLLSALQFPQERQNIFVNRRSARVHHVWQKVN